MTDLQPTLTDRVAESGAEYTKSEPTTTYGLIAEKEKIAAGGEYGLSGERYRESGTLNTVYDLVPVGRFLRPKVRSIDPRKTPDEVFELWSIPAYDAGRPELLRGSEIGSSKKAVFPGDILLSRIIPHIRRAWVVKENSDKRRQIASTEWIVFSSSEVVPEFFCQVLVSDPFHLRFMQTITGVGGSLSRANPSAVAEIQIPLPPLEIQREIVAEIEGYQKVIDGARAVVENYRPHIAVDPAWPLVAIQRVASVESGFGFPPAYQGKIHEDIPFLKVSDMNLLGNEVRIVSWNNATSSDVIRELKAKTFPAGTVIFPKIGAAIATNKKRILTRTSTYDNNVMGIVPDVDKLLPSFLHTWLTEFDLSRWASDAQPPSMRKTTVEAHEIPLPSLATQQAIVAELEAEQALVAANRQLIERFEKKIRGVVGRVGEES